MNISDAAREIVTALVKARIDGESGVTSVADLARMVGRDPEAGDDRMAADLEDAGNWFRQSGLPDVTATVIPQENLDRMRMLPADATVERLGGEANARSEADRVRDFDWQGWLNS